MNTLTCSDPQIHGMPGCSRCDADDVEVDPYARRVRHLATTLGTALEIVDGIVKRLPSPEMLEARRVESMVRRAHRLDRVSRESKRRRTRQRAVERLAGVLAALERLGVDATLPTR